MLSLFLTRYHCLNPGSINAFIFLCSCAKKLIPVLAYGVIIIWIYGVVIFTLFVKYQQHDHVQDGDDDTKGVSKSNGSTSSDNKNENITWDRYVEDSVAQDTFQKHYFGLSMECLPANFRYEPVLYYKCGWTVVLGDVIPHFFINAPLISAS